MRLSYIHVYIKVFLSSPIHLSLVYSPPNTSEWRHLFTRSLSTSYMCTQVCSHYLFCTLRTTSRLKTFGTEYSRSCCDLAYAVCDLAYGVCMLLGQHTSAWKSPFSGWDNQVFIQWLNNQESIQWLSQLYGWTPTNEWASHLESCGPRGLKP